MYEPDATNDDLKKTHVLHNGEEVEIIELTQLVEDDESDTAHAPENSRDPQEFTDSPQAEASAEGPGAEEGSEELSEDGSPENSSDGPTDHPTDDPAETTPGGHAAPTEGAAADGPADEEPESPAVSEDAGTDASSVEPDAAPDDSLDAAGEGLVLTALAKDVEKTLGEFDARLNNLERTFAVLRDNSSVGVRVETSLKTFQERIERIERVTVDDKPVSAAFAMRLAECEERIDLAAEASELAKLREEVGALKDREAARGEQAKTPQLALEELEKRLAELEQNARKGEKKLGQRIEEVEGQLRKEEKKLSQELKGALRTLEEVQTRVKTVGKKQEEALTTLSRTVDERMGESARKLDMQTAALKDLVDGRTGYEERLNGLEKSLAALSDKLQAREAEATRNADAERLKAEQLESKLAEAGEQANRLEARGGELERGLANVLSLAERVAKRVDALENMMSDDAIEKTTAKACLRVLREEIGRLTSR